MERIRDSAMPLVGGLYSGVYTLGLGYQAPVVHQPEWRLQSPAQDPYRQGGMWVGWLDPATTPAWPVVPTAGGH